MVSMSFGSTDEVARSSYVAGSNLHQLPERGAPTSIVKQGSLRMGTVNSYLDRLRYSSRLLQWYLETPM